jgi:hypothetical protein
VYEKSVKSQIPFQVYKYMGHVQKIGFFECTENNLVQCCRDFLSAQAYGNGCPSAYGCKSGKASVKADCPTMFYYSETVASELGTATPKNTYKCTKPDEFYKDVAEKCSIEKSWLTWGKRRVMIHSGCGHAGVNVKECQEKNIRFW